MLSACHTVGTQSVLVCFPRFDNSVFPILLIAWASLVAQWYRIQLPMQDTWV